MSSNAFARSRPRVRHQRVPKTQCYAHPRFLQLVKELARIDEAKREQEESDPNDSNSAGACDTINLGGDSAGGAGLPGNDECSNSTQATPTTLTSSSIHMIRQHNLPHNQNNSLQHHHSHHHHHHHQQQQQQQQQQQKQQQHHQQQQLSLATECCSLGGSINLCGVVNNEAHSSNGYRSLGCDQSTSALHDSFYRQSSNNDNQQQIVSHNLNHQGYHNHDHNQRHYNYTPNHQDSFNQLSSNNLHHPHQDYRCPNKCPSSSSGSNTISLGYSKSGLMEHNSSVEPDHRQDENRSKRKRSTIDLSINAKKTSYQSTSPPSCSKRHKSTPEPARPLSPSFTKCPICLLDCMDRDPSFTNTCFHLFCFVCIENWSKSKATCPLCRTKFSKIIYNIRSASCFDEKVASPIRRDDNDDRIIYEQLQGLTANSMIQSRSTNVDEPRLIFDNLRNNEVLMPHFAFVNQIDPRQVDTLHSFNSVTNNSNFTSNVPHNPFIPTSYNPVGSNYIALIPSSSRIQASTSSPAITSAYTTNASLTSISGDTSNRLPRISRSGRYIYTRNYDLTTIDGPVRVSRSSGTNLNPTGVPIETRHHHQIQHTSHQQHHNHHHNQPQPRTSLELHPSRQSHRIEHPHIHIPYHIPHRHYTTNPNVYSRRPYTLSNHPPPIEQHILDNLYRQMPDM